MSTAFDAPLFSLGRVVATPGALAVLASAGQAPGPSLARHRAGDWGEVDPEDAAANILPLVTGERIVSSYRTAAGSTLWIITEAAGDDGRRASTCVLLPSEY